MKVEIDKHVDIDRIVRDVVRRIREMQTASSRSANSSGATSVDSPQPAGNERDSLVLHNQLITLKTITESKRSLDDVNTVVVHQRAVVTPAVKDELRERKVRLVRQQDLQATQSTVIPLVFATYETDLDLQGWLSSGGKTFAGSTTLPNDCIEEISNELKLAVTTGEQFGVILTSQSAKASCVANRLSGVRAAVGFDREATIEAMATLNANVLIIDPRGKNAFQLRNLIELFVQQART
ncbi:MAG: hypothetical protein ACI9HK_004506 [Pirellulaceae bacterium]|jgi:hypothetical protein